jgi:cell division protein ZapA (FtsZ GTPase activity inhibitor)
VATPFKPIVALTPAQAKALDAHFNVLTTTDLESIRRKLGRLTPEEIAWLHCRLSVTRHDVNGKLLAINLAFELTQIRPEMAAENTDKIRERIGMVRQEMINFIRAFEQTLGLPAKGMEQARPLAAVQEEELGDGLKGITPEDRMVIQDHLGKLTPELVAWLYSRLGTAEGQVLAELAAFQTAADLIRQNPSWADAPECQMFQRVKVIEHALLDFTIEFEHRLSFPDKSSEVMQERVPAAKL